VILATPSDDRQTSPYLASLGDDVVHVPIPLRAIVPVLGREVPHRLDRAPGKRKRRRRPITTTERSTFEQVSAARASGPLNPNRCPPRPRTHLAVAHRSRAMEESSPISRSALPPRPTGAVQNRPEHVLSPIATWCSFRIPYRPSIRAYVCSTCRHDDGHRPSNLSTSDEERARRNEEGKRKQEGAGEDDHL
jgi:hypothetical protein